MEQLKQTAREQIKQVPPQQILSSLSRSRLEYFVKEFWPIVVPDPLVWNWHMSYLCTHLEQQAKRVFQRLPKQKDTLINISPGTSKSTIASIMFPAWCWANDPTVRILTASYSSTLSTALAIKSRDIIRSDKYKLYFPEVEIKADQDNKTYYQNTRGGDRYATSVTGTITGFHAHIIIVDDPMNAQEAISDNKLEGADRFMNQTLSTRKVDKEITPTILIMQRLHEADPSGTWMRNKPDQINHICIPGEWTEWTRPPELKKHYQAGEGLMDPKRLSRDTLARMKKELGTYGYAGQVLQSPIPLEGALWQKEWFKIIPREQIPPLSFLGTDYDLAYTKNDRNSASAYITAGSNKRAGNAAADMYIVAAGAVHLEFPQLIAKMKTLQEPAYVEGMASGKSAVQTLKAQGIPAKEVGIEGGDKIARATLASPYAEAGRIYISQDIAEFILNDPDQGLLRFPNGTKDDLNDALVQAINRLLKKRKILVF